MNSIAGLITLATAPQRQPITVRRLTAAEPATLRRIAELGLTPGVAIQILNRSSTAVIVSTRSSRVAIGLPLASSVLVAVGEVQR